MSARLLNEWKKIKIDRNIFDLILKHYSTIYFICSYALLGPSGCGKSTLLRCILGTMELDSGCIDLKAEYIMDIGYMPQVNISFAY